MVMHVLYRQAALRTIPRFSQMFDHGTADQRITAVFNVAQDLLMNMRPFFWISDLGKPEGDIERHIPDNVASCCQDN